MLFSVRGSEIDFSKITGNRLCVSIGCDANIEALYKAIMSRIKCSLKNSFRLLLWKYESMTNEHSLYIKRT